MIKKILKIEERKCFNKEEGPETTKTTRAFTLLEMLLVIAMIAILAGIVIVAINPGRQLAQSRNAQRASDLRAIYSAVNQYYIDNKTWPNDLLSGTFQEICKEGVDETTNNCINLDILVPDYLPAIPHDPQSGQNTAGYALAINPSKQDLVLIADNSTEYNLELIKIGELERQIPEFYVVGRRGQRAGQYPLQAISEGKEVLFYDTLGINSLQSAEDIKFDRNGNFYIPVYGTLKKFNPYGDLIWSRPSTMYGASSFNTWTRMNVDSDDNLYIMWYFDFNDNKKLRKYTNDGNMIWSVIDAPGSTNCSEFAADNNNNIYLGCLNGSFYKVDKDGAILVDKDTSDQVTAITYDYDGNIYVGTWTNNIGYRIYKYYSNGDYAWEMIIPSRVDEIIVNNNGDIYSARGGNITKYDSLRNELWSVNFGTTIKKLVLDINGYLYAVGGTIVKKYNPQDGVPVWTYNFTGDGRSMGFKNVIN